NQQRCDDLENVEWITPRPAMTGEQVVHTGNKSEEEKRAKKGSKQSRESEGRSRTAHCKPNGCLPDRQMA
ncbi:hypothetical protein, partial [Escherichia coli]|uniref:hypothetical protein n=1 Tax=Escherichia coli TaxID=562 RepID=UPI0039E0338D